MSQDEELLELSAKAVGYVKTVAASDGEILYRIDECFKSWNPLTDDADALRLAVKLGLKIDCQIGYVLATRDRDVPYSVGIDPTNDPAATRRAIVRAAAEIGRSMKDA